MHFADSFAQASKNTAPICIELDIELKTLPLHYSKTAQGMFEFYKDCIDLLAGNVAMISVNLAHFQILGPEGYGVFWLVCQYAKEQNLLVLADAKCAELGAAAIALADTYLYAASPINAVTVHPYFGSDSLQPFIAKALANNKGVFIVLKTNNSGSADVQDLPTSDESVHEYVAQVVESLAMHHISEQSSISCVGAMVSSTYPEEVRYLRTIMPHVPLLTPYEPNEAVHEGAFIANGTGALVTVSLQQIVFNTEDWQQDIQTVIATIASSIRTQ